MEGKGEMYGGHEGAMGGAVHIISNPRLPEILP